MPKPPDNWPAGAIPRCLDVSQAAFYCGNLSETKFRDLVKEDAKGRRPILKPVPLSPGRMGWLREQLDEWLDRQAGRQQPDGNASDWMASLGED